MLHSLGKLVTGGFRREVLRNGSAGLLGIWVCSNDHRRLDEGTFGMAIHPGCSGLSYLGLSCSGLSYSGRVLVHPAAFPTW